MVLTAGDCSGARVGTHAASARPCSPEGPASPVSLSKYHSLIPEGQGGRVGEPSDCSVCPCKGVGTNASGCAGGARITGES